MEPNDNLGTNVCKKCAEHIITCYEFRIMCIESDRRLHQMLQNHETNGEMPMDLLTEIKLEPSSLLSDAINQLGDENVEWKWKCNKCPSGFSKRSELRDHKRLHRTDKETTSFNEIWLNDTPSHNEPMPFDTLPNNSLPLDAVSSLNDTNFDDDYAPIVDLSSLVEIDVKPVSTLNSGVAQARRWKCTKCSLRFETRKNLRQHRRKHRVEEEEGRTKDHEKLGSDPVLMVSNDDGISQDETQWKCKKCSTYFKTRRFLRTHGQIHRTRKSVADSVSGDSNENSVQKSELTANDSLIIEMHPPKKVTVTKADDASDRWICSYCSKRFETRKLLRKHRQSHAMAIQTKDTCVPGESNRWRCNVCGKDFAKRSLMRQHRREMKHGRIYRMAHKDFNDEADEYTCEICTKTFDEKQKIRSHMRIHSRKHLCNVCGLWISSTYNFNAHYRTVHMGEELFPCTQCDLRFRSKQTLKSHLNRHNGIKPFICELCNRSFFNKSELNTHVRSMHENKRQHICSVCEKGFNRNCDLVRHMFMHRQEQPYKCACGLGFQRKYKLANHQQICQNIYFKPEPAQPDCETE